MICGSLRGDSSNRRLLEALSRLAFDLVQFEVFDGLREIPAFEPDEDAAGKIPPAVQRFREALGRCESVAISSPEYAHGVSGALKNALDWIVGSGEISGKPVVLLDAAPHSRFARVQLHEILRTMDARVLEPVTILGLARGATVEEILASDVARSTMRAALAALVEAAGTASGAPEGLQEEV